MGHRAIAKTGGSGAVIKLRYCSALESRDAYYNSIRRGAWSMNRLSKESAILELTVPDERLAVGWRVGAHARWLANLPMPW